MGLPAVNLTMGAKVTMLTLCLGLGQYTKYLALSRTITLGAVFTGRQLESEETSEGEEDGSSARPIPCATS